MPIGLPEPAGFPGCGRCPIVAQASPAICAGCVQKVHPMTGKRCGICAHPLKPDGTCPKPVFDFDDRGFGRVYAITERTGAIERVMKRFKYEGQLAWGTILGRMIVGWMEKNLDPDDYDLIVANPTHASRPVRHTELMLEAAAREDQLGEWPIEPYGLLKTAETSKSAAGNWHVKWAAAQELYGVVKVAPPIDVADAPVLVVDDVTATLAQFPVLGHILHNAGAQEVDGLVISRQVRR